MEEVARITEETKELIRESFVEDVIKDNQVVFDIEGTKYRVRRPTFEDKQNLTNERSRKLISLLKDTNNLLEKDLVQIYESRGVSIAELNRNIDNLQTKRNEVNMTLGKLLTENRPEAELLPHKQEIERLNNEQSEFLMRKTSYLENSIESQVNVYTYVYLAALIAEKYIKGADLGNGNKNPDEWVKAWANYDEFIKQPEITVNKVVWYTSLITRNDLSTL